ncbi:hypothetical protein [Synechocystis sp. LKSZ1]|uniref:hypothetical protein n=1 Tax=Synechocystis sp. LKSZ1 TaxID=3144951 RepID=UPI00336C10D7
MSNITPIQVFPGINDLPTAPTAQQGCNGSFIVEKINKLIANTNYPIETLQDYPNTIERYIDTTAGDDSNDGLTEETAFLTWDRAIQEISGYLITDNYGITFYVKGTLQAPLNCLGVKPMGRTGYNWGVIQVYPYPSVTGNFVIESITEPGNDDYFSRRVFITEGKPIMISVANCDFLIHTQLEFDDSLYEFYDCKFIATNTSAYYGIVFGDCEVDLYSAVFDTTPKAVNVLITGPTTRVRIDTEFTVIDPNTNYGGFINIDRGAYCYLDAVATASTEPQIQVSSSSSLCVNEDSTGWDFTVLNGAKFTWDDWYAGDEATTLFLPAPTDGLYPLWLPQKRCKLYGVHYKGKTGVGTFQVQVGTTLVGDPQTTTFSSILTKYDMNDIEMLISGRFAEEVYLNISNSTGLEDLFIQVVYRNY